MKLICLVCISLWAVDGLAQSQLERMGFVTHDYEKDKRDLARSNEKELKDLRGVNQFRLAGGQIWNVSAATNWVAVPEQNSQWTYHWMDVVLVRGSDVSFQLWERYRGSATPTKVVVVKNVPNAASLVTGQSVNRMLALPIGTTNWIGLQYALYDHGSPSSPPSVVRANAPSSSDQAAALEMWSQALSKAENGEIADAAALMNELASKWPNTTAAGDLRRLVLEARIGARRIGPITEDEARGIHSLSVKSTP